MTLKSKLKTVLDHTTQLEAMMKALMKHHAISVEEKEEGEDDDQKYAMTAGKALLQETFSV